MITDCGPIGYELHGRLWHTTSPVRYQQILTDGEISPNPNIPDAERWKTDRGPDFYPYVRHLGGVSLFDFSDFEPIRYQSEYPASDWRSFVPIRSVWGTSVWIEICRAAISENFISGDELIRKQRAEEDWIHDKMPEIEAACIGPIPVAAFRRALIVNSPDGSFQEIACEAA